MSAYAVPPPQRIDVATRDKIAREMFEHTVPYPGGVAQAWGALSGSEQRHWQRAAASVCRMLRIDAPWPALPEVIEVRGYRPPGPAMPEPEHLLPSALSDPVDPLRPYGPQRMLMLGPDQVIDAHGNVFRDARSRWRRAWDGLVDWLREV